MSYRSSYTNSSSNPPPSSTSSDLSSLFSGMSLRARAAAQASSSLISSATNRIAANAPAQVTNVREYWSGWLTGRNSPENSHKYVVLQPGWAVKRPTTGRSPSQACETNIYLLRRRADPQPMDHSTLSCFYMASAALKGMPVPCRELDEHSFLLRSVRTCCILYLPRAHQSQASRHFHRLHRHRHPARHLNLPARPFHLRRSPKTISALKHL